MANHLIPILADAMKAYYKPDELVELFGAFDTSLDWEFGILSVPAYLRVATKLIKSIEHSNNRRILEALVPSLIVRCKEQVAKTGWEKRGYHEEMLGGIEPLRQILDQVSTPGEVSVPGGKPFTAKSEIRSFLEKADGPVFLIDPWVGPGTLDCLREVAHAIRILTSDRENQVENGFDRCMKDFASEGHPLEVRQHSKLHDRFLIFNDRCWMVGSSIKDAGKKALNVIECVGIKSAVVEDAEAKWIAGRPYPRLEPPVSLR